MREMWVFYLRVLLPFPHIPESLRDIFLLKLDSRPTMAEPWEEGKNEQSDRSHDEDGGDRTGEEDGETSPRFDKRLAKSCFEDGSKDEG